MLGAGAMSALAVGAISVEVLAPLVVLCWLCCWPDEDQDDDSSSTAGKPPKKPVLAKVKSNSMCPRPRRGGSYRSPSRRLASSAASLHLPGSSGMKQPLSAHRSDEEIPRRRRSNLDPQDDTRYHSAPSIIDEVIHRRDWERSTKDLYIPLRPEADLLEFKAFHDDDESLEAPKAYPESTSIASFNKLKITCKKHYTNIKSSKNRTKKEENTDDYKDTDATELGSKYNFFIGDSEIDDSKNIVHIDESRLEKNIIHVGDECSVVDKVKSVYKAKEAKQTLNESIRSKELVSEVAADGASFATRQMAWCNVEHLEPDLDDATDRSGAMHRSLDSRYSLPYVTTPLPEPSDAACMQPCSTTVAESGSWRARTGSEGAIPPPAARPESGAFSESDLEVPCSEPCSALQRAMRTMPTMERVHDHEANTHTYRHDTKETAI